MKPNGELILRSESPTLTPAPARAQTHRYQPPGIEWEEPLESVARFAAGCAKVPGEGFECEMGGVESS